GFDPRQLSCRIRPESRQRGHQQSARTRNTVCAVSPSMPFFCAALKYVPSTTFLGSGSPIGNGWSEPSMTRAGLAFFARYSSVSESNTQESKYIASKPLRGSAYLPCELAWLRARRPSALGRAATPCESTNYMPG